MAKPLDLSRPPFQTDENPPRPARLLCDDRQDALGRSCIWLVKNANGIESMLFRPLDGHGWIANAPSIVNAQRCIPFWIFKAGGEFGMYTTKCPSEYSTAEWRGPFYMDEDGNPCDDT